MVETKNILLIGRTGEGKSTLANVIIGAEKFTEGKYGVSETKKMQSEEFTENGTNYRIIDTIGFDDTELLPKEVMKRIITTVYSIKDGLNQVLFVTGDRFTEREEKVYDLLKEFIFNEEIAEYTTIVKTKSHNFSNKEKNEEEHQKMLAGNGKLARTVKDCNGLICIDNPSVDIDDENEITINKKKREKSREVLMDYLRDNCKKEDYKLPQILEELNDKISDRMSRIKELEKKIDEKNKEIKSLIEEKIKEEEFVNQQAEEKFKEKWQKYAEKAKGVGIVAGSLMAGILLGVKAVVCVIM